MKTTIIEVAKEEFQAGIEVFGGTMISMTAIFVVIIGALMSAIVPSVFKTK